MNVRLNGQQLEIDKEVMLIELLKMKGLELERIVIEYNFEILKREDFGRVVLKENDNIEILRFVGGG